MKNFETDFFLLYLHMSSHHIIRAKKLNIPNIDK
jgi:hypothetical protein